MNATDTHARILAGFDELAATLRGVDEHADTVKRIKANTQARLEAKQRVAHEWDQLGLEAPSDLALSITALREFGYFIPEPIETDSEEYVA